MKRLSFTLAIVLCLSLIVTFAGCGVGNIEEKDPINRESDFYSSTDMDEFIKDWSFVQQNHSKSVLYETVKRRIGVTVTVPKLETQDFTFFMVEADEDAYDFYFVPVDFLGEKFDHSSGIVVSVSRAEGSFTKVIRDFNLTQNETEVHDEYHNVWYLNYSDRTLKIAFPEGEIVENIEVINQYFSFYDQPVLSGETE